MQENPSPRHDSRRPLSPAERDDMVVQRAVLDFVLAEHPTHLSAAELARELCRCPDQFAEGDALERAVRDLLAAGLLHRNGAFLLPTRAALHFHRLDCD